MKKGFLLLAIVLWGIVAAIIIGAIIYGINGGFGKMIRSGTLIKTEEIISDNIQKIVIEGSHQAVEIRKTDNRSIIVKQYGREKTSGEDLFLVSASDDNVRIYFNSAPYFSFFNFNINDRLVVEIPENFAGNLDAKTNSGGVRTEDEFVLQNVELKSSSGGIHINKNLTAGIINASTSSGGIHIVGDIVSNDSVTVKSSSGGIKFYGAVTAKNLKAETTSGGIRSMAIESEENVEIKSSSGGIKLEGAVKAEYLKAETTSGGIRLGIVNVQKYYLKSSSGGINAESISGGGEAETSSGGINISLKNPKDDVRLACSSGGIKIALEPSLQFTLDAQTNSGGIHTNFAIEKNVRGNKATAKIGDNPAVNIFAHTSSGGIRIEK